ncbi:hypothetical protein Rs2_22020 [Raphanus sativus]|nr:Uncharacterized protein Rs2_22012 [Raphanus sativus]KAJ4895226.1 hypothetical protein Rs2_22020 [Raphanus sativus]
MASSKNTAAPPPITAIPPSQANTSTEDPPANSSTDTGTIVPPANTSTEDPPANSSTDTGTIVPPATNNTEDPPANSSTDTGTIVPPATNNTGTLGAEAVPMSLLWTILNSFLTLVGFHPAAAAVPTISDDDAAASIEDPRTPRGAAVRTISTAAPPGLFSSFLACFGAGRTTRQGEDPSAQEEGAPLLPQTIRASSSPPNPSGTSSPWKIFRRCLCLGGGEGSDPPPPPPPSSSPPGCFWKMMNYVPDYEAYKAFFKSARQSINWLVTTLFGLLPAKVVALSVTSSIALSLSMTTTTAGDSTIPLQTAVSDSIPLHFIQSLILYATLSTCAAAFVNGKLRLVFEVASLGFGAYALYRLLSVLHLQLVVISDPFAWVALTSLVTLLLAGILDLVIRPRPLV